MELILKSKKGTHYAKGILNSNGTVVVLKGSLISPSITFENISKCVLDARNDRRLVNEKHLLISDIEFKSVSTAAQFVTGRSVNGKIAWRIDDKISLKDYYKQQEGK